jgi:membrane-bound ClpP family serine protease
MDTVYLVCFGVGLVFAVVSAFFADVFGGHDVPGQIADSHAEGGFASGEMPGFSPLSPTTLAAFVTGFGGFGLLFDRWPATSHPAVSATLATIAGFIAAAGVFWLFRKFFSATQSSSEGHVAALAGLPATIITPIPQDGVGEIAYVQGGSRYTSPARAEDGRAIAGGASVQITRIVGTQLYVRAA